MHECYDKLADFGLWKLGYYSNNNMSELPNQNIGIIWLYSKDTFYVQMEFFFKNKNALFIPYILLKF